jgi:hypothetical protein
VLSVNPPPAAPGAPGAVKATASGSTVKVTWTASSGTGPISYTVEVSTSTTMSGAVAYNAGSATTESVTGLNTSTTYYFEVVATNSGGSTTSAKVSTKG